MYSHMCLLVAIKFPSPKILKSEDQSAVQAVMSVCQSMVDCLVEILLTLDENSSKIIKSIIIS